MEARVRLSDGTFFVLSDEYINYLERVQVKDHTYYVTGLNYNKFFKDYNLPLHPWERTLEQADVVWRVEEVAKRTLYWQDEDYRIELGDMIPHQYSMEEIIHLFEVNDFDSAKCFSVIESRFMDAFPLEFYSPQDGYTFDKEEQFCGWLIMLMYSTSRDTTKRIIRSRDFNKTHIDFFRKDRKMNIIILNHFRSMLDFLFYKETKDVTLEPAFY